MNVVLEEILRTQTVRTPGGEALPLRSAVTREEGEFLQGLVSELGAVLSLEVGLAYGLSALFICEALSRTAGARHIVIDPKQLEPNRWQGVGLENLKRAGYGAMVEFYPLPSHQALPQLDARGVKVDFAFIDGWHVFDYALLDFFYIDRLLRVGGVVALDDAWLPGVRKVCRYIVTNRSYRVLSAVGGTSKGCTGVPHALGRWLKPELTNPDRALGLSPHSRCVALRKEAEDNRPWDFHQEF